MAIFFIYILAAYLIGSIPTAIWYGKFFHKTDIRKHGSGNAGATNTIRTFGKLAGFIVLFIDIAKGYIAVHLAPLIYGIVFFESGNNPDSFHPVLWMQYPVLVWGLAAALGHIYPIYEKFKGGKGVATLLGVLIALYFTFPLLSALGIFVLMFVLTKRVSIGSILSGVAFAVAFIVLQYNIMLVADYIVICLYPLLIMYTHRSNIMRLINGTEPRMSLGKKKI